MRLSTPLASVREKLGETFLSAILASARLAQCSSIVPDLLATFFEEALPRISFETADMLFCDLMKRFDELYVFGTKLDEVHTIFRESFLAIVECHPGLLVVMDMIADRRQDIIHIAGIIIDLIADKKTVLAVVYLIALQVNCLGDADDTGSKGVFNIDTGRGAVV